MKTRGSLCSRPAAFFSLLQAGLMIVAVGCEQKKPDLTPRVSDLELKLAKQSASIATVEGIEFRLKNLEQKTSSQASALSNLQFRPAMIERKSTVLDLSTTNYQYVESNAGRFLVYCESVQPYLDGQKLKLRIGNPNLITYSGFTLKAKWGRAEPDDFTEYENWRGSLHEKELELAADLKPGVWNTVEFVLSPASATDLAYVEVSITTNRVMLYKK
jgi:uncharacterized coiled-coil protein SlyX